MEELRSTPKVLLSIADVAYLTGLSLQAVTKLVNGNQIPVIKIGRRRLVARQELEAFIVRTSHAASVNAQVSA